MGQEENTQFLQDLEEASVYTIKLPKGGKWEPAKALALIKQIAPIFEKVTLRVIAEYGSIKWQVLDLRKGLEPDFVIRTIRSVFPEVEIETEPFAFPKFEDPFVRSVWLYEQAEDFISPILTVEDLKDYDPLVGITQSMTDSQPGERIIHMLHIAGLIHEREDREARKRITRSNISIFDFLSVGGLIGVAAKTATGNTREPKYVEKDSRMFFERLNLGLYRCYLFTQLDLLDPDRTSLAGSVIAPILNYRTNLNALIPTDRTTPTDWWEVEDQETSDKTGAIGIIGEQLSGKDERHHWTRAYLSEGEIAALWHLPDERFTTSEIEWQSGTKVPVPVAVAQLTDGYVLGDNVYAGKTTEVKILEEDRKAHLNIVGKTGVGKTTLMHNLIHQDIAAGRGVGVIDPGGELIDDILAVSIPEEREKDLIILDIADEEHPPPLNPLVVPGEKTDVVTEQVTALLEKFGDFEGAGNVQDLTETCMSTLFYEDRPTLRDVSKLFSDRIYRESLLAKASDPILAEAWDEFERLPPSDKNGRQSRVNRRIRKFYRGLMLPIMCHPRAIDFVDVIHSRKILLASLKVDERKMKESSVHLLGATLIAQFQMAAMASRMEGEPFFLYVDEVQNFITSSLERVLSQARKFNLHMTIANQFLGQLEGKLLEAVMGTVGATIVYRVGTPRDARTLEPHFKEGFTREDLLNMDKFAAAVKMQVRGETQPAFSVQARPQPGDPKSEKSKKRTKNLREKDIIARKMMTRDQVDAWLDEKYPRLGVEPPPEQGDPDWIERG